MATKPKTILNAVKKPEPKKQYVCIDNYLESRGSVGDSVQEAFDRYTDEYGNVDLDDVLFYELGKAVNVEQIIKVKE